MKPIFALFVLMAISLSLRAETLNGKKVELSISGAYQSSSYESGSSSSSSSGAFYVSPRVGVFLIEGLEFEPELSLVFGSGYSAYILNGNLAYNVVVHKKDYAFVLAGYGYSNALPFLNGVPIQYGSSNTSFGVLNLGCGLKVFIADNVAMRVEFRHQRFAGTRENSVMSQIYPSFGSSTTPVVYNVNTVSFGFSIFV
jgi:hypothetical protein